MQTKGDVASRLLNINSFHILLRFTIRYIFLKRFSKAWRASVGRDGDGCGLVAVEGWEYEVGAVSFSMVMRNS